VSPYREAIGFQRLTNALLSVVARPSGPAAARKLGSAWSCWAQPGSGTRPARRRPELVRYAIQADIESADPSTW